MLNKSDLIPAKQSNKNNHLEAIRGIAAFLVVMDHLVNRIPEVTRNKNHLINFVGNWAAEAVMMFFILSGIVIHASIQTRHRSRARFLVERIMRIHPILLISLIVSVLMEIFIFDTKPDAALIVGNFVPVSTLQGYMVTQLWKSNPVIWSLSCEMFFYVVFALFAIRPGKINYRFIIFWFVLGVISIYFYYHHPSDNKVLNYFIIMLSYSPVWIVGFFIWYLKDKLPSSFGLAVLSFCCLPIIARAHITTNYFDPIRNLLFAIGSIPFFLFLIQNRKALITTGFFKKHAVILFSCVAYIVGFCYLLNDSSYPFVSRVLYICFPVTYLFMQVKWIKTFAELIYRKYILRFFEDLGSLSYSIYLIHNPLLVLIPLITAVPLLIKFLIYFPLVYFVSYLLERKYQPIFNRLLKRKPN